MPSKATLALYRSRSDEELLALTPAEKTCRDCGEAKSGSEFARDRSKPDGRDTRCKACARQATAQHRRDNPERVRATAARSYRRTYATTRAYRLKRLYGLTRLEYDDLYQAQDGRCAICRKAETARDGTGAIRDLAVDHCHNSNRVRGLLCSRCNSAIGLLNDDVAVLRSAIAYLMEGMPR